MLEMRMYKLKLDVKKLTKLIKYEYKTVKFDW